MRTEQNGREETGEERRENRRDQKREDRREYSKQIREWRCGDRQGEREDKFYRVEDSSPLSLQSVNQSINQSITSPYYIRQSINTASLREYRQKQADYCNITGNTSPAEFLAARR